MGTCRGSRRPCLPSGGGCTQDALPRTQTLHYLHMLTISQGLQVTAELPAFQSDTWRPPTPTSKRQGEQGTLTSVVKGDHVVAEGTQHLEVKNKN